MSRLCADQHRRIPHSDILRIRNVHGKGIHTDASHDRNTVISNVYTALTTGQLPWKPIAVSHG